jgi:hypothetical protein
MPRRVARFLTRIVVDGSRQIEVRRLQLDVPRLDLRKIEDVVDESPPACH